MRTLLLAAGLFLLTLQSFSQFNQFTDTTFHFAFEYPETWTTTGESGENLRTVLLSPDEKYTLAAYGFYTEAGYYDIEKFAVLDTAMFQRLGEIKETNYQMIVPFLGKLISEMLSYVLDGADEILYVEKKYDLNPEGYYARSYIAVDEHYAYVLIAYSKTDDFDEIEPIFDSFEAKASWFTKIENDLSWEHRKKSLKGFVISLLVFLYFSGIVLSGRNFKKWTRRRKALLKFKNSQSEEYEPDRKWRFAYKGATRKIIYALLLFLILGIPVVIFNSGNWILWVGVPFFFMVGYLGYALVIKEP